VSQLGSCNLPGHLLVCKAGDDDAIAEAYRQLIPDCDPLL